MLSKLNFNQSIRFFSKFFHRSDSFCINSTSKAIKNYQFSINKPIRIYCNNQINKYVVFLFDSDSTKSKHTYNYAYIWYALLLGGLTLSVDLALDFKWIDVNFEVKIKKIINFQILLIF